MLTVFKRFIRKKHLSSKREFEMTKEALLALLDCEQVKEKVRNIISNGSVQGSIAVSATTNTIPIDNQDEIIKLKNKIEALNNEKKKENDIAADKIIELKSDLAKTKEELNYYKTNFSEDVLIEEHYSSFTQQTKNSLSGIFKSQSIQGLIVCGCQEKSILNLWDFIKNKIVEESDVDSKRLIELYHLLFARFKIAHPFYVLQEVTLEHDFDNQKHIMHNKSSNSSGKVKEVLLNGVVNSNTGKLLRPSVVLV